MDAEEALNLVGQWLKEKGQPMTELQQTIFYDSWNGLSYSQMAKKLNYKASSLSNRGSELWELLSELTGKGITKPTLKLVLEPLLEGRSLSPPPKAKFPQRPDWDGAPDVSVFFGRTEELAKLEKAIAADGCRLAAIWGSPGVGKTTLAAKLGRQIQHKFKYVIWRSLCYSPTLPDLLKQLLNFFIDDPKTVLPNSLNGLYSLFMDYLSSYRCLIILDGLEHLLQKETFAGKYRSGCDDYSQLFRDIGTSEHQSCLLLTTTEKTRNIDLMSRSYPQVQYHQLLGLKRPAAKQLLQHLDLKNESYWGTLIDSYAANPLYLKIISALIQEMFDGDVLEYYSNETTVLDGIKDVLDLHFKSLTPLEIDVVFQLANAAIPLNLTQLQESIPMNLKRSVLMEAVKSLKWRSLLEQNTSPEESATEYYLPSVVKKYILKRYDYSWKNRS